MLGQAPSTHNNWLTQTNYSYDHSVFTLDPIKCPNEWCQCISRWIHPLSHDITGGSTSPCGMPSPIRRVGWSELSQQTVYRWDGPIHISEQNDSNLHGWYEWINGYLIFMGVNALCVAGTESIEVHARKYVGVYVGDDWSTWRNWMMLHQFFHSFENSMILIKFAVSENVGKNTRIRMEVECWLTFRSVWFQQTYCLLDSSLESSK